MSKGIKRQDKVKRRKEVDTKIHKRKLIFRTALYLSSLLITLPGLMAAALALLPRVSVVPSDPIDVSNPFNATFTITNTNFIPLRQVNISLGLGQISLAPRQPDPTDPKLAPYFRGAFVKK